jgi:hypothetical protein
MFLTYPPLEAPEVEVEHTDGTWHGGFLECWRRDGDRWTGRVRYSVGVGAQHIAWVDEGRIRRVQRDG